MLMYTFVYYTLKHTHHCIVVPFPFHCCILKRRGKESVSINWKKREKWKSSGGWLVTLFGVRMVLLTLCIISLES